MRKQQCFSQTGAEMNSRHEDRVNVYKLIFEQQFHAEDDPALIYVRAVDDREIRESDYLKNTYAGVAEHTAEIDEIIGAFSDKWKVSRMSRSTRAVLRLAVYEMMWGEVPPKVAINEAVEIAKEYDTQQAPPFINGILNRIAREKGLIADQPKQENE